MNALHAALFSAEAWGLCTHPSPAAEGKTMQSAIILNYTQDGLAVAFNSGGAGRFICFSLLIFQKQNVWKDECVNAENGQKGHAN